MTNTHKYLLAPWALVLGVCWTNANVTQHTITEPMPKSVQQRTAKAEPNRQEKLALCLKDWDNSSHMSKFEWRRACERSVSLYPTAFR
jgi:hypothetical protein